MRLPTLKSGYSLDLDSTELLHEDGHQEGVQIGYTRKGLKPCLHPLLAVIEEAKLVVQSGCALATPPVPVMWLILPSIYWLICPAIFGSD